MQLENNEEEISIPIELLTEWSDICLTMNHQGTLAGRAVDVEERNARALNLIERARRRAWALHNDLLKHGARKPKGYAEPDMSSLKGVYVFEGITVPAIANCRFAFLRCSNSCRLRRA